MYQIYADKDLIYDSTLEDYKIAQGVITKELDRSGSFVFSLYPDHPYYSSFVKLKTVVKVMKSGKIAFRGRVLNDTTDYWNKGDFTCEGELGFLQDSIVRPFEFQGTPAELFRKFIEDHNAQVDEFKQFKIGQITVVDPNDYINRSTSDYPTTLEVLKSALTGSGLGGHIYITHGYDGTEEIPTIHYLADFPKTATQAIEFGVNLRDFVKTDSAEELATAVIPLGVQNEGTGGRLTIADVNDGVDYLYNAAAVAARGWVFKTAIWDDVMLADNLKKKGQAWLDGAIYSALTVEMTALDLHLLDRDIESYNVCEYVHATSKPHRFDEVMLCSKQTMDLLKPESDTITLGFHTTRFTDATSSMGASVSSLGKKYSLIEQNAEQIKASVVDLERNMSSALTVTAEQIRADVSAEITDLEGRVSRAESSITQTATEIRSQVSAQGTTLASIDKRLKSAETSITQTATEIRAELQGVADSDGKVTAASIVAAINSSGASLDIDFDNINLTGYVTFDDLEEEGETYINAGNIRTGTLSADRISGGTLSGVTVESVGDMSWDRITIEDGFIRFDNGGYLKAFDPGIVRLSSNKTRVESDTDLVLAAHDADTGVVYICPGAQNQDTDNRVMWAFTKQTIRHYKPSRGWVTVFTAPE